mgnify:CR=1 FL=1
MSKKQSLDGGLNGKRGKPLLHKELKNKFNASLTPSAIEKLKQRGLKHCISPSEYMERLMQSPEEEQFDQRFWEFSHPK